MVEMTGFVLLFEVVGVTWCVAQAVRFIRWLDTGRWK